MHLTDVTATVTLSSTDLLRQHLNHFDSQAGCLQDGAEPGDVVWERPAGQESDVQGAACLPVIEAWLQLRLHLSSILEHKHPEAGLAQSGAVAAWSAAAESAGCEWRPRAPAAVHCTEHGQAS